MCKCFALELYQLFIFTQFVHIKFIFFNYLNYDKKFLKYLRHLERFFNVLFHIIQKQSFCKHMFTYLLVLYFLNFLTNIGFSYLLLRLRFICAALFFQIATNLVKPVYTSH